MLCHRVKLEPLGTEAWQHVRSLRAMATIAETAALGHSCFYYRCSSFWPLVSVQYLCSKDEVECCLVDICFQVWVTKSLFPMLLVKICRRCSSRMWHLRLRECPSPLNGLCNQVWIEIQPCGCDRSTLISTLQIVCTFNTNKN